MNNYTVYCHIFPNGKRYVGITKQKPEYRWDNGNGYRNCTKMARSIKKYGWHNVEHKILYTSLSKEIAEQKEKELIKEWKTNCRDFGYNIEGGGNLNKDISEETKKKLSKSHKGQIPWIKGKKHKKLSNEKNRQAHLGKPPTVIKPVICLDTSIVYPSVTEAGKQLGLNVTHISSCCTGKRKTCGKLRFSHYKGGDVNEPKTR
jgi:group I intron endonuclease